MFIVGVIMIGAMALGYIASALFGGHSKLKEKSRAWSIVLLVLAIIFALPVVAFAGFLIVMEIKSRFF